MRFIILILSICVLGAPLFAVDLSKSLGLLKAKLLALGVELGGEKKIEVKIEEIKIEEKLEEEDITKSLDYFVNTFLPERKISNDYINKLNSNKKTRKKKLLSRRR